MEASSQAERKAKEALKFRQGKGGRGCKDSQGKGKKHHENSLFEKIDW
jgi:hypothetical protein